MPASRVLLGFTVGCGLASGLLAGERLLHHAYVYQRPGAFSLHLSASLLVGLGAGLALGVPSALLVAHLQRRGELARRRALANLAGLGGAVVGSLLYVSIVGPSKYGRAVHPAVGALLMGALVAFVARLCAPVVLRFAERRPRAAVTTLLLLAVIIAWTDAHAFLRSYGNVHVASAFATWAASGVLGSLLLGRLRRPRLLWGVLALVACAALVQAMRAPVSMSARIAVLEFGAGEKLLIQHVLWPLFDGDGDGYSRAFLGTDCDDADAANRPDRPPHRMKRFGCTPLRSADEFPKRPQLELGHPVRNLVWIVIDAWRLDTPRVPPPGFYQFMRFTGYRSCGSRTQTVLDQVMGMRGCAALDGPSGLPGLMSAAGYAVKAFGQYDVVSGYIADHRITPDAGEAVENARQWIALQQQQGRPYFAFVHLKGGHAPYSGSGGSERERYDASIADAIEHAAQLVKSVAPDAAVVIMGDHGEEFGEHEGRQHALSLYEEVVAAPVFMRIPGWSNTVESGVFGCIGLQEMIWRAVLGDPYAPPESKSIFSTVDSPRGIHGGLSRTVIHSLRFDSSWKVIWKPYTDIWELYELKSDPGEHRSLADTQPAKLRAAASRLLGAIDACVGNRAP